MRKGPRSTTLVLLLLLWVTSSSACGRYGPPLRGPAPAHPAPVIEQPDDSENTSESPKQTQK